VFAKRSGRSNGDMGISRSLQIKDDRKLRASKMEGRIPGQMKGFNDQHQTSILSYY
jgi:hypothetical protein